MEVMMNSQEDIINEIERIMSEEYPDHEVRIEDTNRQGKTGKMVIFRIPNMTAAPSLHISDFEDEDKDAETIARGMINLALRAKIKDPDLDFLMDYENVKDKLYVTIGNTRFENYLRGRVYHATEFENLVMLPKIKIELPDGSDGSIPISESLVTKWDVNKETVFEDALLNSQKIMPFIESPLTAAMPMVDMLPFKVYTNVTQIDGSNIIMYPSFREFLDENYETGAYIIPASRHEVLIMNPDIMGTNPNSIQSMLQIVKSVNTNQISKEDYLSDNVYLYKDGKVESYS